jgi:hypothetical protein
MRHYHGGMDRLGEDLVLLAVDDAGRLTRLPGLPRALLGVELVRLAAAGRIRIVRHRVVVHSELPLGDREVDAALGRLVAAQDPPPYVGEVMRRTPRGIREAYLARLADQGAVRRRSTMTGRVRWNVIDTGRRDDLYARIETIVTSDEPVSADDAMLAALIRVAGLDAVVYPGLAGWPQRQRLEQLARNAWPSEFGYAPSAACGPGSGNALADGTMQGSDSRADHDGTGATIDSVVRDVIGVVVRDTLRSVMDAVPHAHHHGHSEHGGISHGGGHHGH